MVLTTHYAKSGEFTSRIRSLVKGPSTWCLFMAGFPILSISGRIPHWLVFSTAWPLSVA